MARASSIEGASLFDIVVVEKGCAGGGFGPAKGWLWTCLLCVFYGSEMLGLAGSLERSGVFAGSGVFETKAREVTGS